MADREVGTDNLDRPIIAIEGHYPGCFRAERVAHNWLVLTKMAEPIKIHRPPMELWWELTHYWCDSRTPDSWDVLGSTVFHHHPSGMDGYRDHDVSLFEIFEVV